MTVPPADRVAADLVALVGSRIAHDLASPLGAIANGVELLGLAGQADSPELALITESVTNATARIKAFRIAFGAARPGQTVSDTDLRALFAAGPEGRRLEIDGPDAGDVPRPAGKLILLALMCVETALPWGGRVQVTRDDTRWQIAARGERMRVDPALWAHLATPQPPASIAPAEVHFALIGAEAAAQGRSLAVDIAEPGLTISF